jgi:hypothetical protein
MNALAPLAVVGFILLIGFILFAYLRDQKAKAELRERGVRSQGESFSASTKSRPAVMTTMSRRRRMFTPLLISIQSMGHPIRGMKV